MTATVFIDGEAGTTGLQIHARLADRKDVELLHLDDSERKDPQRRQAMLNRADLSILCLPDDAAREAVSMIEDPNARVIDASTAHRVADDWVYGMAEYDAEQQTRIASAKRVSNPGCYPVATIALVHPLVEAGIVPADWPLTINAVSGYSGGGKSLIAAFEDEGADNRTTDNFQVYGLALEHKHAPEIHKYTGLKHRPLFVPSVGRYAQGMIVQVPLQLWAMPSQPTPSEVHAVLADYYAGRRFVTVASLEDTSAISRLQPEALNDTNELRLHIFGNEAQGQVVLMGLLDNLGKGASGMAVQNMNIMLGLDEATGLA
ncbi:MAG: N-acetyl-gamma-glutamyl-phosphate reductase [Rhodospirillaceae bacterium]|nr:N-acetyl-gamma-glutamyl-phosphate reductase [Rhodospirillaceae bacterium]